MEIRASDAGTRDIVQEEDCDEPGGGKGGSQDTGRGSQTHRLHPGTGAAGPRGYQWHPTVAELSPRTGRRTKRRQRQESGHALGRA
ncbi:hypothetical protein NDU88_006785 [Pleurodeles waltl]|uniref:Uncharacterized protein n=1 Tax=Pleurodeles waltl TaxID=8319 RepID=A0AAV7QPL7_PLEWA|nr:hypothetical protein NDU88_006785 [Pleurodeles waltl]